MIEVLKQAYQLLLTEPHAPTVCDQLEVILRQAIAELESQEPVAWGVDWGKAGDIPCVSIIKRLPNGGIEVVAVEYAPYSYTHPPQRTEQNFCPRCGKRTNDIHTCTPPQAKP
jgi:hypothetical protein